MSTSRNMWGSRRTICLIVSAAISITTVGVYGNQHVAAAWDGMLYAPGETLDPECAPTEPNCSVVPPASSGTNSDIIELRGLNVAITTLQGGTGISGPIPLGTLLFGSGTGQLSQLTVGSNGQTLTVSGGVPVWGAGSGISIPSSGTSANTSSNSGLELNGSTISMLRGCTGGQILKWSGMDWGCSNDVNTTYTAGSGLLLTSTAFSLDTASANNWTGIQNFQNGFTLNGSTFTNLAGTGLKVSGGGLAIDPTSLPTTTTSTDADQLMLYDAGSGTTKTITRGNLLAGVLGSLNYKGTWNAATNTPVLSGTCDASRKGFYYTVSTSGTTNLDGINSWTANDWAVCNGTAWGKVLGSSPIVSVFGRTGTVVAANGDYTAGQITNTPAGTIASTTVQAALNELDSKFYSATTNPTFGLITATTGIVLNNGAPITTNTNQNLILQANGTGQLVLSNNTVALGAGSTSFQTNTATTTALTLENIGSGIENLNLADGNLQTNGVTRLTNAGALQNITGLTINTGVDEHTPVATLGNTTGSTAIYTTALTPEGDIAATVGALAIDHTSGTMFIKTSGSGTTGWTQFGTSNGCTATGCTFTSTGTNTVSVSGSNGGLTLNSNGTGVVNVDSGTTGAVNVGTGANSKTVTVGNTTGTTGVILNTGSNGLSINGNSTLNGSLTQTGSLDIGAGRLTVDATTGNIATTGNLHVGGTSALDGNVTVGANALTVAAADGSIAVSANKFTVNGTTGAVAIAGATIIAGGLTNGAQTYTSLSLGNFAAGGAIGTAATTVDLYSSFNVAQTTAGQTLTLPTPTVNTAGRVAYVTNNGSASFGFYGLSVSPGASAEAIWNGTWNLVGAGTVVSACSASGCTFTSTGTNTISVSGTNGGLSLDANGTGTIALGAGSTGGITIGATGNATAVGGSLSVNGNVVLGADSTKTVTVNGKIASSIDLNNNLLLNIGNAGTDFTSGGGLTIAGTLVTNGAQSFGAIAIANLAAGGAIGTAATTVDVASNFAVNQTTAAQTITLPNPTVTTAGRIAYIGNTGTTSFSFYGQTVAPNQSAEALWNGTAWTLVGTPAVASVCTTSGCTFTSTGTNTVSVSGVNGGLTLNSNGTGAVNLDSGTTGAVNVGTGANAKTVTIGNTTGASAVVVNTGSGNLTVNGASTLNGTLGTTGNLSVGANMLTVSATDGSIAVNTNKFNINGTTGAVAIAGTVANGSQTYTTLLLTNLASGGAIGTAAATVDQFSAFKLPQTTASQTITLPSPTITTAGKIAYITNTGSAAFSFYGLTVASATAAETIWDGAAWNLVGAATIASACTNTGCTFTSTGTNTINVSGVNGGLTLNSNGAGAVNLDSGTTGGVNVGTNANAKTVTIGNTTGASAVVVNAGSGKFTVNGNTVLNGTLTGTGSVDIGTGKLTIAAGDGTIVINTNKIILNGTTGDVFISGTTTANGNLKNGAQTYISSGLGNYPVGGNIGTAATTVDLYSAFSVIQTTVGQTLTLPTPATATLGRVAYIVNNGTAAFTFYGLTVNPTASAEAMWNGTAWNLVGASTVASGCTTTGCTFTSTGTNTINVSGTDGGLTLNSNGAGTVNLDSGTTGAVNIGTNANAKTLTFGNATGATAVVINSGTGGLAFNTAANGNIVFSPNGSGLTIFGTAANGLTISSAGVINYTGTSRPTTHVRLTPEYPGVSLTPSGTNNTGTMTSDYCSNGLAVNITICPTAGNIHSYYSWTTASGTAQNYDIYVQYNVPLDFSAFTGTFKTFAWRTGASDSVVVNLYNGSTACGTFTATTTNTTWTQGTVTPTCSPVAGDNLTVKISLTAVSGEFARAGEIEFDYLGKY